jgi:hypothetical protein
LKYEAITMTPNQLPFFKPLFAAIASYHLSFLSFLSAAIAHDNLLSIHRFITTIPL